MNMSRFEFIVVVVIGTLLAFVIILGAAFFTVDHQSDIIEEEDDEIIPDDTTDDMELVPITLSPGYEYSISNVQMNLTLTFKFNDTVLGVLDIYYECELYSISCLLNEDGEYDLVVDIVGFYLNASITTGTNISGGSLTIDDFHYEGVIEDCAQDAITEEILKVAEVEQWMS